jgi:NAD(P)-dependent dehydrogenase (short-subunit alcohol dehydrogenase family)
MPSIQDLFNLAGRVAIVTGGSRGLGEEMAEGLAEAGASLVLCARRDEWLTPTIERFHAGGVRVEGVVADVSKPADVQAVVDTAIGAFGQVDILVNNAGVTWGARPEAMPLDKWQKVLDINLTGAFLFAQAAGREMLKRQYGRIINVASIAGVHASVNGPHYAGRQLGARQHPRECDRARILSFAARRSGHRTCGAVDQGFVPHSARRGGRRAEGGRRVSGG